MRKQKLQGFIQKLEKSTLNYVNFSMRKLHKLAWKQLFRYKKWDHYYFRYKIIFKKIVLVKTNVHESRLIVENAEEKNANCCSLLEMRK